MMIKRAGHWRFNNKNNISYQDLKAMSATIDIKF